MVSFIYLFCIWYHHHYKVLFFFFFVVFILVQSLSWQLNHFMCQKPYLVQEYSQERQRMWTELLLFNLCFVFKIHIIQIILKHFCNSSNLGKILTPFNLWFCIPVFCGIYPTLIFNRNAACWKSFSKLVVKLIVDFMKPSLK